MEKLGVCTKEGLHASFIVKLVQYVSEQHHNISLLIISAMSHRLIVCHYLIYKENLLFYIHKYYQCHYQDFKTHQVHCAKKYELSPVKRCS